MKVLNIDIDSLIKIKSIEDIDTGDIKSVNSTLKIPTGNFQNILLNFNFISPKIEDDMKIVASFGIEKDKNIDVVISNINVNNKDYQTACYIPPEIFLNPCKVTLGVYGFSLNENETLKKRFSLIPISEIVVKGSYNSDSKESITPSPTIFEVYFNKIDKAKSDFELWIAEKEEEINESILEKISYLRIFENHLITTSETSSIPINLEIQYNNFDIVQVKINGLDFIMGKDFAINDNKIIFTNPVKKGNTIYYSIKRYITTNPTDYEMLRGPEGYTPQPGVDYNTEEDKNEIKNWCKEYIDDNYSNPETDPTIPSYVKNITEDDISNWNNKLSSVPNEYITKTELNNVVGNINTILSTLTTPTVSGGAEE